MRIKRLLTLSLITVCVLGLAAVTFASSEEPQYGGTLRVARVVTKTSIDVNNFDTYGIHNVATQFYETLVDRYPTGEIHGLLAKDWTISDDGLVYTFNLQPNVQFHDGTTFDAVVVKWNLERKIEKKLPLWDLIPWDKIEVVDPLTVKITLTRPSPEVLGVLNDRTYSMYSPTFVNEVGDDALATQACGTGPFMVERYLPNEILVLKKNPNYWQEGLPYLDEIIYHAVPDTNTRSVMLEAGDVDLIQNPAIDIVARLEGNPDFTLFKNVGSRLVYVALNTQRAPFNDVRVRQAANYAIDKEGILQSIYRGTATISKAALMTSVTTGYEEIGYYPYNPDKARELLEAAGWAVGPDGIRRRGGQKLSVKFYARKGAIAGDIETAEFMQAMLVDVGFDVDLLVRDTAGFLSAVTVNVWEADYDMVNLSWGTYTGDASWAVNCGFACKAWAPVKYNRMYFCDGEVERLREEAYGARTLEERAPIYRKIYERVFYQAPIIQLFDILQVAPAGKHVHNVGFEPSLTIWPLRETWIEN